MKYIIKNCPNYLPEFFLLGACKCEKGSSINGKYIDNCKDVTDCLLKQIVNKCKKIDCDVLINTSINNKGRKNRCGAMDNMPLCCEIIAKKDILGLLEIEEVNE